LPSPITTKFASSRTLNSAMLGACISTKCSSAISAKLSQKAFTVLKLLCCHIAKASIAFLFSVITGRENKV